MVSALVVERSSQRGATGESLRIRKKLLLVSRRLSSACFRVGAERLGHHGWSGWRTGLSSSLAAKRLMRRRLRSWGWRMMWFRRRPEQATIRYSWQRFEWFAQNKRLNRSAEIANIG